MASYMRIIQSWVKSWAFGYLFLSTIVEKESVTLRKQECKFIASNKLMVNNIFMTLQNAMAMQIMIKIHKVDSNNILTTFSGVLRYQESFPTNLVPPFMIFVSVQLLINETCSTKSVWCEFNYNMIYWETPH